MISPGALPSAGSPVLDAAVLIGIVLIEAVALYLGYGALEQAVGPSVIDRIKSQ